MKFGGASVTIAAVVVACGGETEVPPSAEVPKDPVSAASGTRLEVRRWSHGDVFLPSAVYDTKLGVECEFMVARDGVERCLPAEFPEAEILFTDPDCKSPVALRTTGCSEEEFRYDLDLGESHGCGTRTEARAYEFVREIEKPLRLYGLKPDGECFGSGAAYEVEHYYELRELDPGAFVAAERVIVPRTEELGTEMIVAKDGLRLPQQIIRLESAQRCLFIGVDEDDGGQTHCLTGAVPTTDVFTTDDECTTEQELALHAIDDDDCGPPEVVIGSAEQCGVTPLFELGAGLPAAWYENGDGVCSPAVASETERLFEIGEPRRADEYPIVQVDLDGTGRLARIGYFSEGTWLLQTGLWDRAYDAPCYPVRAGDGKSYCLPNHVAALDAPFVRYDDFADEACTSQVVGGYPTDCPATSSPRLFSEEVETGPCGERSPRALYEAMPFDGDVIYVKSEGGECTPAARNPDFEYTVKGAELVLEDTLVELTLE